jgi:hypothetical protein
MVPGGLYQDLTVKIKVVQNRPPRAASPVITYPPIFQGDEIKDQYFLTKKVRDPNDPNLLALGDRLEYSITAGPKWLHVSPIGRLYGKPSVRYLGANRFNLRVVDLGGAVLNVPLVVRVKQQNLNPYFAETPLIKAAWIGRPLKISLANDCLHLSKTDRISFKKISGPSWLRIDRNGKLSGRLPKTPGRYTFEIRATNRRGLSTTTQLHLDLFSKKLYIYEGFEGAVGEKVTGTSGGVGWTGSWENKSKRRFAAPGLSFPGLTVIGNKCDNEPKYKARTNNDLLRKLSQRLTVGKNVAAGEHPEIWMSALFEVNPKAARSFPARVFTQIKLYGKEGFLGAIGKVNGTRDHMGYEFPPSTGSVSKKLSHETPTLIFMVLKLAAGPEPNTTQVTVYSLLPDQLKTSKANLNDPETFPDKKTFVLHRKASIDYIVISRSWEELGFVDEIRISNTYKGVLGK